MTTSAAISSMGAAADAVQAFLALRAHESVAEQTSQRNYATGGMVGTFFSPSSSIPMPRYFFNVYHNGAILDEEGYELADRSAAWAEATAAAGEMIRDLDGRL